jgi:16S rRNA processing protein RimM
MEKHPGYFQLGSLVKTHGVKGDFIAIIDSDSPSRYRALRVVYLEVGDVLKEYTVSQISLKPKSNTATVHLVGIEDRTTAEEYLKLRLFLPLDMLPALKGKKFYFHEVIGFNVVDKHRGVLGPITTVYERSSQPVIECMHEGKQVLFPVHDDLIVKIDRKTQNFHVDLPEGLIDLYLE